jgi:hypothetical protein
MDAFFLSTTVSTQIVHKRVWYREKVLLMTVPFPGKPPQHQFREWNETQEVVLCYGCKGAGYVYRDEVSDYHKREYRRHYQPCTHCNNTGRHMKTTKVTCDYYDPTIPKDE